MPKKKEDFTSGISLKDSLLDFKETEKLINTQSEIVSISLDKVVLPPQQARRYFDEVKLKNLADNIKKVGLLQFPVIRERNDGKFDLIAGERRVRAGKIANLDTITCRIIECDDKTAKEIQLVENLKREDLNAWEETRAIMDLLCTELDLEEREVRQLLSRMNNEQTGRASKQTRIQNEEKSKHNVMVTERIDTIKVLFDSMGLMTWESYTKNRLPLLNLHEDVTENLATGKIEYTKARVINKIKDDVVRLNILNKVVKEQLSLEQIKALIPKPIVQTNESEFKQAKKRVANIGKKINAKLWKDTDKALEIDSLISQLEKLLGDTENLGKE
ncbi:MAG: ParB/RepB/Spo0J family partition protein [Cyanobacteriota bacterium]|nr:ParB/RepB/Spo0J family partition protein [Cyanobacteriota bacterium]